ncbi:MAG: excinuclease ABC subunit UvrC [Paludibacteraceae bacterium]|nr:excinuclease ABC subunit UvrC [Paludibacteraceae bacterium]
MPYTDHIKQLVAALPNTPGVYQYFNQEGTIIYVGKAKNLKRRVSSYFNKKEQTAKVTALVKHIYDLKYIVVENETDALLLENNLIKQYQPHYNILLKDGKTYPWLCITKEEFPRIFKTRQVMRGAEYFGPYSSVWVLDTLLELIRSIYPIRTCKFPLFTDKIDQGKYKLCLEYHIKNCKGPCEGKQSKEDYQKMVAEIREIAKGNSSVITSMLTQEMKDLAAQYRFEEAAAAKAKLDALLQYRTKTVITTTATETMDVMGYEEDGSSVYINMLHIVEGSIVKGLTIEYNKQLDEPAEDLLAMGILELRQRLNSTAKQVLVPFMPAIQLDGISMSIPQRGDKKKLLDLSAQNVKQYKVDKYKQSEKLNPEQRQTQLLGTLKEVLKLDKIPLHIECFDNSHISGDSAVAACVVFKKAKPSKKDYRKYTIKTGQGADDYASMREVVYRRYKRMIDEQTPLPDLIIADGGIGQMESIRQVIEDDLKLNIPIAGLAKNEQHQTRELLFGFPPKTIGLKPTDACFKFLAQIQEEVHRFAIEFHRDKRSKKQTASTMDEIKGIGEETKNKLLLTFKSVKRIKEATLENLENCIGKHRASIVYDYFHGK